MAKEFDIEIIRGDTTPISFSLIDKEGNPLIPTNSDEIYFTMKKDYKEQNYILQKKYSSGDFTIDENKINFVLSHEDTAELNYGNYVYDIEIISGDYVQTIVLGRITLADEATWIDNE